MGQRTQVLIIKHSKNGQKQVDFYHCQWGYGRCMYLAVMYLYIRYYNTSVYQYEKSDDKTWEERKRDMATRFLLQHGTLDGLGNFYHENKNPEFKRQYQDILDKADINDFESIWNACLCGDNNNGWCVIDITPGQDEYDNPHFKIGWILGTEETMYCDRWGNCKTNKYYKQWMTSEEYGKLNGGSNFSDKKFIKMFRAFCDYFDIEEIKKKDVKKVVEKA